MTGRAIVIALALGIAVAARAQSVGFDHLVHEGKVVAGAGEPPACDSCHREGGAAPPGHAACFSSGCHTMPRGKPNEAAGKLCTSCHDTPAPAKRSKAHYPPYALDRDFATRIAHDGHVARSTEKGSACQPCHADPGGARAAGHTRCAGCHGEAAPAMTACAGCHVAIAGRDTSPRIERGAYSVVLSFSHERHLQREPATAERCIVCHANVAGAAGEAIPAPTMRACESCHDGKRAFSTLTPTCRRCHVAADDRALPSGVPHEPFSHEAHAARGMRAACDACHTLAPDGAPRPAALDHIPCATEDCHAAEFRAPRPRICSSCHVGTEPWRALRADVPRRTRTEFGVDFSHAAHLEWDPPRVAGDCASCHTGIAGGPEARLGRGHASCAGSGCHAATGGAAPSFDRCATCHVAGLLPTRDARRAKERWSVGVRFRHAPHTASCATCHVSVAASRTVDVIETPRKRTCAPCHDGATAFKMTGHGCARCHGK